MATLWHLGMPKYGSSFAPSDEHDVVVVNDEVIDPTARQFDKDDTPMTRRPLEGVVAAWRRGGETEARRARAEILNGGITVLAHSDWVVVQPGSSIDVDRSHVTSGRPPTPLPQLQL